MVKTPSQIELKRVKAKYHNDITELLRPYYSFRLYIKFIKPITISSGPRKGEKMDRTHRFGFESICSYNQCLHGHFENIELNKERGFRYCTTMTEVDFKNLFYKAQIYTRSVIPDGKFDVLLREYDNKGEIIYNNHELIQQLTHPDQNKTLYFTIDQNNYLQITEDPIPSAEKFKQILSESLNEI